jgi:hypothetical protein
VSPKLNERILTVVESDEKKLLDSLIPHIRGVVGVKHAELADHLVAQLAGRYLVPGNCESADKALALAIQAFTEMAPQNLTEAMLAVQLIGVNEAANNFLRRAMVTDQPPSLVDANVLRVTRLMRLFLEQVELMQRLRGKTGLQRVVVEHVNVHEGGQAIVGVVGGKPNDP